MIRKVGVLAALVVAGVAIAVYIRGGFGGSAGDVQFTPQTDASAEVRIADLERALAAAIDRSRLLESRIAGLEARTGGDSPVRTAEAGVAREKRIAAMRERAAEQGQFDPAAMRERMQERQLERFVAAGFTRERAEAILRRTEELEVQAMQAQYDAQRNGRPGQGQIDVERALRTELGDAEYERYLTATGRPTEVQVMNVLASSAAERSGLQSGDQIVSYAGTRVYDMRELNALTREGTPGESVTMEVRRNGQTLQVQVARGVLGMSGGGRGAQGGPGGFRPGRP